MTTQENSRKILLKKSKKLRGGQIRSPLLKINLPGNISRTGGRDVLDVRDVAPAWWGHVLWLNPENFGSAGNKKSSYIFT